MVDTSFFVIAYVVLFIARSPIESVEHVAVGLNAVLTAIVCDVNYCAQTITLTEQAATFECEHASTLLR